MWKEVYLLPNLTFNSQQELHQQMQTLHTEQPHLTSGADVKEGQNTSTGQYFSFQLPSIFSKSNSLVGKVTLAVDLAKRHFSYL